MAASDYSPTDLKSNQKNLIDEVEWAQKLLISNSHIKWERHPKDQTPCFLGSFIAVNH